MSKTTRDLFDPRVKTTPVCFFLLADVRVFGMHNITDLVRVRREVGTCQGIACMCFVVDRKLSLVREDEGIIRKTVTGLGSKLSSRFNKTSPEGVLGVARARNFFAETSANRGP